MSLNLFYVKAWSRCKTGVAGLWAAVVQNSHAVTKSDVSRIALESADQRR